MSPKFKLAQLGLPKLATRSSEHQTPTFISLLEVHGFAEEAVLGSGSVACVKRVRCRSQGDVYAAKCVSLDPESIELAEAEHKLLSSIRHPHIIRTNGFFQDSGSACLLLEYCSGGNLEDYVGCQQGLSDSTIRTTACQLLSAVNYLHCKRIVHRDLKPANIFVEGELVKIGDFNSAKLLSQGHGAMLSHRCTRDFAAPELVLGWDWNERVDIWSLGLCLYFMKQNRLPFEVGKAHVQSSFLQYVLPEIDWYDTAEDLKCVIQECLAIDMRGRPPAIELLSHPALRPARGRRPSTEARKLWTEPHDLGVVDHEEDSSSDEGSLSPITSPVRTSQSSECWQQILGVETMSTFQQLARQKFDRAQKTQDGGATAVERPEADDT